MNWFNETDATYRSDLRELNDLNFARFDAKLEQRVTQSEAKLAQRLAEVQADLRQELAQVKADVRAGVAELRGELRAELHAQSKMLIKWMFGFWMATVTTLAGLMVAVLRFLPAVRP